jgi:hypothetical protein
VKLKVLVLRWEFATLQVMNGYNYEKTQNYQKKI